MRLASLLALLRPATLALLAVLALTATASAQAPDTPLDGLLRPDGTIDTRRAAGAGALDLSGFDVAMTPDGLRAIPQARMAPGD